MSRIVDKILAFIVRNVIIFLVKVVYCPKVFFEDENQKEAFAQRPSILVSNHTSHLDGGFVNVTFLKNDVHALAAKDRFEEKWKGFLLRHTGCIPIDRINPDMSWIHESIKILNRKNGCISIYPEGMHGSHRKLRRFHPGVTMLALTANVPLIMVYIDGPHKMFHRTGMIIGKPFTITPPTGEMTSEFVKEQTHILQDKMTALMNLYISKSEK